MAKDQVFNAKNTEPVDARKETKVGAQNAVFETSLLGGNLQTGQGGDAPSPAGANAGSLSVAGTKHGKLVANPNIPSITPTELDADGNIDPSLVGVIEVPTRTSEQRAGQGKFGSANTGEQRVDTTDRGEVSRDNISMPTNQNSQNTRSIPNVASRFMR